MGITINGIEEPSETAYWSVIGTKLGFDKSSPGAGERAVPPNKIVVHWTASETRPATNVAKNLHRRRKAGIHFIIGVDVCPVSTRHTPMPHAVCVQAADPSKVWTYHVGERVVRESSIGIEMVSAGTLKNFKRFSKSKYRPTTKIHVRGREREYMDFYPWQYNSLVSLCNLLCKHYGIPKLVPREPFARNGIRYLREFRGVMEHFHLPAPYTRKIDAGGLATRHLLGRGYRVDDGLRKQIGGEA